MGHNMHSQVIVVGGGFTGLTAAFELAKSGIDVRVLEATPEVGGLAAAFDVEGVKLDRFYHHWFTNDLEVMGLIDELGMNDHVQISPTNTGVYYNKNFFKLSTPMDLLRFTPLNFVDRVRLGLLALRARRVRDWKLLENKTAEEWLLELGGKGVYRVVWEPLLKGKFGPYAKDISAVWFWNKLKLRGGSRGKGGEERLAYFKGGFVALAEATANKIRSMDGELHLSTPVEKIYRENEIWHVVTPAGTYTADKVIATPALPLIADFIKDWASKDYYNSLNRIKYIGNVCLILELDRSLSETYWLNVNDPNFPFVGVIEHTNFEKASTYGGRHIVYLSKYLPHTDQLYSMSADEFLDFALPYLKQMFPQLDRKNIIDYHLWRERWSQPVVEKHYGAIIPGEDGPIEGFHICSMAQIYPEDRGTNYAIREGRKIGRRIGATMITKN
ncbi:MAG: NAD(P)/FAD-dependent oxidoreductase [Allorhizobium sp.]